MRIAPLRGLLHSNLLLAAAALGAGLLAAWLGARQLSQRTNHLEQQARQRYAPAPFIVASRDVEKGQRLDASMLSIRSMPRAYAPADALSPADAGLLMGERTAIGIRRGTPVVPAALLPKSSRERLSEKLPDGMRALTIQVDSVNSMSGHLAAGDTVDIFYSRPRANEAVLVPLLQRVRVLATGDLVEEAAASVAGDRTTAEFSSATLLVSGADARRVVLAEQTGRLTLVLRRGADPGLLEPRAFSSAELVGPARAQQASGGRNPHPVELLVGGNGATPARRWLWPGMDSATGHGEGA